MAYSKKPIPSGIKLRAEIHSPISGAPEKIATLRTRHGRLISSISRFEARVTKQTGQLAKLNKSKSLGEDSDELDGDNNGSFPAPTIAGETPITREDFRIEEEEIEELEKKKRALEDRVAEMERDLGGLLR